jgi:hypothetical protein
MRNPWVCEGSRLGATPVAQSTSAVFPQRRHTTWWWLSPDAQLVARGAAGWLDVPHELSRGQGSEHVVDGLHRHPTEVASHSRDYRLDVGVRGEGKGPQYRHAVAGDTQPRAAQPVGFRCGVSDLRVSAHPTSVGGPYSESSICIESPKAPA